jgi:hypothetical protein
MTGQFQPQGDAALSFAQAATQTLPLPVATPYIPNRRLADYGDKRPVE